MSEDPSSDPSGTWNLVGNSSDLNRRVNKAFSSRVSLTVPVNSDLQGIRLEANIRPVNGNAELELVAIGELMEFVWLELDLGVSGCGFLFDEVCSVKRAQVLDFHPLEQSQQRVPASSVSLQASKVKRCETYLVLDVGHYLSVLSGHDGAIVPAVILGCNESFRLRF